MTTNVGIYILEIGDSKIGSYEEDVTEPNIRAYFTQCGFVVSSVAMKASGHVFIACSGNELDITTAWKEYSPSLVNPVSVLAEEVIFLCKALPKLLDGTATVKDKDDALAIIVKLALQSFGAEASSTNNK